jgi:hypothetical protein
VFPEDAVVSVVFDPTPWCRWWDPSEDEDAVVSVVFDPTPWCRWWDPSIEVER